MWKYYLEGQARDEFRKIGKRAVLLINRVKCGRKKVAKIDNIWWSDPSLWMGHLNAITFKPKISTQK